MMQMKRDLGNRQGEQGLRCLLCDSSGHMELKPEGGEWVRSPIQCLDRAMEGKPVIIAVRFWKMPMRERETLVELCAALKRNSRTRSTPVLALLHTKHRGLMEALKRAGVDLARFIGETTLSSTRLIEIIDGLGTEDRVERQWTLLCPYLDYDAIDSCHEMTVCGAYLDRMVLGGKRLHEICETEDHLHCEYYLNPRIKE
ncbi:MAG: hypothetical protein QG552_2840 [Thermodesulfobacteriota bacterium]|nr:hypothetical protein [Thermodesulfobacteriota bacterium]